MSDRATLRSYLRDNLNDTDVAVGQGFTDDSLNRFLFRAVRHVSSILQELDEQFFLETTTQAMAAADTTITLPTGFKTLIDLRRQDNNRQFKPIDIRDIPQYLNITNIDDYQRYLYYMTKDQIVYVNPLNEAHTAVLRYIKEVVNYANDSTDLGFNDEAEELVVIKATIMCLKSEQDSSKWADEYNLARERLENNLQPRNRQEPRYVNYKQDTGY